MRLYEKYRPTCLADIVGQFPVRLIRKLVDAPYPCCLLLEGPPGCGKTATALAFAAEVGCVDDWSGLHIVTASEFSVDAARRMFEGADGSAGVLRLRPFQGKGWQVVVLEELEWLSSQCQVYLKVALESRLPSKCIVVATSNGAGKLQKALLQRFKVYRYSAGETFAAAAQGRLAAIWQAELGREAPLPNGWSLWGWADKEFSLRLALDQMQDQLALLEEAVA